MQNAFDQSAHVLVVIDNQEVKALQIVIIFAQNLPLKHSLKKQFGNTGHLSIIFYMWVLISQSKCLPTKNDKKTIIIKAYGHYSLSNQIDH